MGFIEMGDDHLLLEWREHALSDLMSSRGEPSLVLEPVFHAPDTFPNRRLDYHLDPQAGVLWSWGKDWKEVLAKPQMGSQPANVIKCHTGEQGFVAWSDVPFCDYLELTPIDQQGNEGVTRRIKCPVITRVEFVDYESAHNAYSERIRVKLRNGVPLEKAFVQKLQFSGQGFQAVDKLLAFNRSSQVDVPVDSLRGVIAVFLAVGSGERRLISYRWYIRDGDKPENRVSEADWIAISERLRTARSSPSPDEPPVLCKWLKQWPSRSQSKLDALRQAAIRYLSLSPTQVSEALQQTPTGLFRAIVLHRCNYSSAEPLDQLIRKLHSLTSLQVLQLLICPVPTDFEKIPATEKEWILRQRSLPNLVEAVNWAKGHGIMALGRALELIDIRATVRKVKGDLRTDNQEWVQADGLLKKIEQAPFNNDPIGDIRKCLRTLQQRIDEDRKSPINPIGPEPITLSQHYKWLEAVERLRLWQVELARIIHLCETGQWQRILPDTPPVPGELERRLSSIKAPGARPRSKTTHDLNDKIKHKIEHLLNNRLIQDLISYKPNKDQRAMYVFALEHLRKVILPHADCWAAWYEDIHQANSRASEFPWFARSTGIFSRIKDLPDRVRAAQDFLDMIEMFERTVSSWIPSIRFWKRYRLARTQTELEKILSSEGHPRVAEAYQGYMTLRSILGSRAGTKESKQLVPLPAPPRDVSMHTIKEWWEKLATLDRALDVLGKEHDRFECSEKRIYLHYQPKIRGILERWKDAKQKPHYYRNLEILYQQCEKAGTNVTREAVNALIDFIRRTPELESDIRCTTEKSV